jgi:hypothetical protein
MKRSNIADEIAKISKQRGYVSTAWFPHFAGTLYILTDNERN